MRLKWSTLTKYNKQGSTPAEEEAETDLNDEKARQEFVVPSSNGMPHDNWWYEHDDGVKKRVPSTWKFPMLGLEDMYVLWHCGDVEQKISPMKLFQASDLSSLKRAKTNLSEVRAVMVLVDLEAVKEGMTIKTVMTPEEAQNCCSVGYPGLNIPPTTPDGRTREILRMKWSSAVRLKNPNYTELEEEEPEEEEEADLPEAEIDV